jgi:DNA-binding response OmpR family regulator
VAARVLLVEDDESLRRSTELLLARAGLEPTSVATGEEGLSVLDRCRFDVVLLDLMLPGADWVRGVSPGPPQLVGAHRDAYGSQ